MRLNKFMVVEGINDKGIFKAVFLAGHPGAGKTTVLNKVKSGSIEPRWVNTDKVFPLFKEWWSTDWPKISNKVTTINKNQLTVYINSMLPLAIDGTAGVLNGWRSVCRVVGEKRQWYHGGSHCRCYIFA